MESQISVLVQAKREIISYMSCEIFTMKTLNTISSTGGGWVKSKAYSRVQCGWVGKNVVILSVRTFWMLPRVQVAKGYLKENTSFQLAMIYSIFVNRLLSTFVPNKSFCINSFIESFHLEQLQMSFQSYNSEMVIKLRHSHDSGLSFC